MLSRCRMTPCGDRTLQRARPMASLAASRTAMTSVDPLAAEPSGDGLLRQGCDAVCSLSGTEIAHCCCRQQTRVPCARRTCFCHPTGIMPRSAGRREDGGRGAASDQGTHLSVRRPPDRLADETAARLRAAGELAPTFLGRRLSRDAVCGRPRLAHHPRTPIAAK